MDILEPQDHFLPNHRLAHSLKFVVVVGRGIFVDHLLPSVEFMGLCAFKTSTNCCLVPKVTNNQRVNIPKGDLTYQLPNIPTLSPTMTVKNRHPMAGTGISPGVGMYVL